MGTRIPGPLYPLVSVLSPYPIQNLESEEDESPNSLSHLHSSYIERVAVTSLRKIKRRETKNFSTCKLCDRTFDSGKKLMQELRGSTHSKRVEQQKNTDKKYRCGVLARSFMIE